MTMAISACGAFCRPASNSALHRSHKQTHQPSDCSKREVIAIGSFSSKDCFVSRAPNSYDYGEGSADQSSFSRRDHTFLAGVSIMILTLYTLLWVGLFTNMIVRYLARCTHAPSKRSLCKTSHDPGPLQRVEHQPSSARPQICGAQGNVFRTRKVIASEPLAKRSYN
jgi:hypothetical protein